MFPFGWHVLLFLTKFSAAIRSAIVIVSFAEGLDAVPLLLGDGVGEEIEFKIASNGSS